MGFRWWHAAAAGLADTNACLISKQFRHSRRTSVVTGPRISGAAAREVPCPSRDASTASRAGLWRRFADLWVRGHAGSLCASRSSVLRCHSRCSNVIRRRRSASKASAQTFDRERNATRLSQRPCSIDPQHGSHLPLSNPHTSLRLEVCSLTPSSGGNSNNVINGATRVRRSALTALPAHSQTAADIADLFDSAITHG
jgi:hypothetical protein